MRFKGVSEVFVAGEIVDSLHPAVLLEDVGFLLLLEGKEDVYLGWLLD
jgi:hypothetical protein